MTENNTKQWYDNKVLANFLLFAFFPVGLYALWKARTIAKWWKITATVIVVYVVYGNTGGTDNSTATSELGDNAEKIDLLDSQVYSLSVDDIQYDADGNEVNRSGRENEEAVTGNEPYFTEEELRIIAEVQAGETHREKNVRLTNIIKEDCIYSSWDGSYLQLNEFIKARLNDPESFKHIGSHTTPYYDGHIRVSVSFSANNAFGGRVKSSWILKLYKGCRIEIVQ